MDFYSKGYALWLMPKGDIYKKYAGLIKKLAKEYNGPVFEPHITLLGDIELPEHEVKKRTEELISGQKPLQINLGEIGYEDYHFRALFVQAVISPQLQNLHDRTKQIFNMEIPPYMAHLSLLYGNYPNLKKEKIIKSIGRNQNSTFEINNVFVQKAGLVKDWKIIGKFPFR
ncbi:2'-5' RNA ligase family protein [Candidatus Daviesbacteria bacterium]|nr:2'-5' RNA ligase family protein [Candidatus Daviesbacteria bacterium]